MSRYLAPDYIRSIQPYPLGKPADLLQRQLGVDRIVPLASNENTTGPSPRAVAAMRRVLEEVHIYPDGGGHHLRQRLAELHRVEPEQVILGSGSGELIDVLCRTFVTDGDPVVMSALAFAQFRLSALSVNARVVDVPPLPGTRKDDPKGFGEAAREARLVFLADPNNPTGTYWSRAELDAYFALAGDAALTVVDQAYFEYVDAADYPNGLDDLAAGRNVLVLRTFSKVYGLAALRIGYGVAAREIIEQVYRARLPFNTSSLGQAAALAALDDAEHVAAVAGRNRAEREWLAGELSRRGLAVTPSVANFLLVDFPRPGAEVAAELERFGVLVRPMGGYGLPRSLRITLGTREENQLLLAALGEVGFPP